MPEKKKYTAEEYFAMDELEGRYELVSGELYNMAPAPRFIHQKLLARLVVNIGNYIDDNKGECTVLCSPFDIKLADDIIVQPDVFVVCDSSKFDEFRCNGAPDWVIEILSPSNSDHDTVTKLDIYSKAGVREYWIVSPMSEKVLVYPFEESKAVGIYTFDDMIPAGIYKSEPNPLMIRVRDVI